MDSMNEYQEESSLFNSTYNNRPSISFPDESCEDSLADSLAEKQVQDDLHTFSDFIDESLNSSDLSLATKNKYHSPKARSTLNVSKRSPLSDFESSKLEFSSDEENFEKQNSSYRARKSSWQSRTSDSEDDLINVGNRKVRALVIDSEDEEYSPEKSKIANNSSKNIDMSREEQNSISEKVNSDSPNSLHSIKSEHNVMRLEDKSFDKEMVSPETKSHLPNSAEKSYREPAIQFSDSEDESIDAVQVIQSESEDEMILVPSEKNVIHISSDDDTYKSSTITQKLNQTTFKQTTLDHIVRKTPRAEIKMEKPDNFNLDSLRTNLQDAMRKENNSPQGDKIFCTQKEYTVQATKVGNIKTDLKRLKLLLSTIKNKSSLPDGGANLKQRETHLEQELLKEEKILSKMIVEDDNMVQGKGAASLNWEQIQKGSAAVVPSTWGKQAMQTHNLQKALTMDRLKALHGSLEKCPGEDDLAEDPKYLKVDLMPHQKRALAWLLWREQQKPSGGILADDMGLGKTLTMISLVMKSKELNVENDDKEESESESDKENNEEKEEKRKTKLLPNGGTLVICPASLLQQWEGEVQRRTKRGIISVELYHGNNRENKPNRLAKQDIVVTTYNLAMREFEKKGPLFRIRWRRIILDEAHYVRNHKSQTSIAMCGLKGKSRWALTGTPVHNKELDLYALLKFLRCSPFDDLVIWKRWVDNKNAGGQERLNMVMRTLMLRRTKAQLQENCSSFKLPEKKYEVIEVKLEKSEEQVYQKVLVFSRTLFAQFLHQRTEKNVDLAYRKGSERPAFIQNFSDPQNEYYKLHKKMLRMHGTKEVKSHEILVLLLRLRQICCHPSLITSMLDNGTCEAEGIEDEGLDVDLIDKLQNLELDDDETTNTQVNLNESNGEQENLSAAASKVLNTNNPIFKEEHRNVKIQKIIDILKNRVIPENDKAVVVSQWTSMLRLVRLHCAEENINCDMLDGSVPVAKRNDIVKNFNDPNNPNKVLLLSLTAGGVGLNLIGGNHLLLLDLHWNPQLESQAQDRIYRVGQTKPVYIYKLLTLDTIEERIKALQESKLQMASDVLSGTKVQPGSKLSLDDLRMLFSV